MGDGELHQPKAAGLHPWSHGVQSPTFFIIRGCQPESIIMSVRLVSFDSDKQRWRGPYQEQAGADQLPWLAVTSRDAKPASSDLDSPVL